MMLPAHVQVKVDNGALSDMQGIGYGGFTKSLRYGGQLQLEEVGGPPPSILMNRGEYQDSCYA